MCNNELTRGKGFAVLSFKNPTPPRRRFAFPAPRLQPVIVILRPNSCLNPQNLIIPPCPTCNKSVSLQEKMEYEIIDWTKEDLPPHPFVKATSLNKLVSLAILCKDGLCDIRILDRSEHNPPIPLVIGVPYKEAIHRVKRMKSVLSEPYEEGGFRFC